MSPAPWNPEALRGYSLRPDGVRDLRPEALDSNGRLRVLPAAFWHATTVEERGIFGSVTGIYSFPTVELVNHLRLLIDGRKAIEIGAGHGVLAEALGIPATDSYQQNVPKYRALYEKLNQRTVPYGPNVLRYEAQAAIGHFKPDVVLGAWVTHRYDPRRHAAGGNAEGIKEESIIRKADYIMVGNQQVHAGKSIWSLPHTCAEPSFVFSRALNGSPDFVAVWPKISEKDYRARSWRR